MRDLNKNGQRLWDALTRHLPGAKREPRALVMLGIDFGCHQWHLALTAGGQFQVRAFIDDEPWNHKTLIEGAPVHYPSEVLALLQKHHACALLQVEDTARPAMDTNLAAELKRLKIPLLTLPARLPEDPSEALSQMLAATS